MIEDAVIQDERECTANGTPSSTVTNASSSVTHVAGIEVGFGQSFGSAMCVARDGEGDRTVIHLLGSTGFYWGHLDYRDAEHDILRAHVDGNHVKILTIQDVGWITHLSLTLEENRIHGRRDGRAMTCTRHRST